jgi:transcriptional regulator with XRE-family HTH domain
MNENDGTGAVIGELIRRYRTAAGLTQEELSEKADISVRAVRNLEHGLVSCPRRSTLQLLAGALRLDKDKAAGFIAVGRRSGEASPPAERPAVIVVTRPQAWGCRTTLAELPHRPAATVLVVLAVAGHPPGRADVTAHSQRVLNCPVCAPG